LKTIKIKNGGSVIEAVQFDGENTKDIRSFVNGQHRVTFEYIGTNETLTGRLRNSEGWRSFEKGEYLIRKSNGECYTITEYNTVFDLNIRDMNLIVEKIGNTI